MSPRAAWQLEAMGFKEVYDFVDGKQEWSSNALPLEGKGPHYPLVGEAATREGLLVCAIGDRLSEVSDEFPGSDLNYCVVVNDHEIVLGRIRKATAEKPSDVAVEEIMETGPTTVRPTESARSLLERMDKRNVPFILVTTKTGRLVGVARRRDLRRLVEESANSHQRFA